MKKRILATASLFIAALVCIGVAVAYGYDSSHGDVEDTLTQGVAEVVQNEYVRLEKNNPNTEYTTDLGALSIMPAYYDTDVLVPSFAVRSPSFNSSSKLLFWSSESVSGAIDRIVTVKNVGESDAYVRTVFLVPVVLEVNVAQDDWELELLDGNVYRDGGEYRLMVATYRANGGKLAASVESEPNLLQVLLRMNTTPEELSEYIDAQGKLKLYIVSQAVQSENFGEVPKVALDKAFGQISVESNPWK